MVCMAARLRVIDRNSPLLLPIDLRDWIARGEVRASRPGLGGKWGREILIYTDSLLKCIGKYDLDVPNPAELTGIGSK